MQDEMEDLNVTYPGAGSFVLGDTEEECNAQLDLIRSGAKTANCALFSDFADDPKSKPQAGRCDIATEWDGTPALVIRTTKVQKVRFDAVTEEMAQAEMGGGDLAAWQYANEAAPGEIFLFEFFDLIEDLSER